MTKKITFAFLIASLSCTPAFAIEVPKDAQKMLDKPATAYESVNFNKFLMACGLQGLSADAVANVPASYAKVSGGKVKLNSNNMAYPPAKYDAILSSYGLQLNPDDVASKLGFIDFAKIKKDKVVFGKSSVVYNKSEWITILSCYSLPTATATATVAGMPGDADGDGVTDAKDACPGTPKGTVVDDRGCWSHSAALLFALDSAVINTSYQSSLNETKAVFDAQPDLKVQIDGYTCDLGADAYNQTLSVKRAQAVRDFLVNKAGVNASRLSVKGYGETNPAYTNDSETNRAKNRRVEFTPVK